MKNMWLYWDVFRRIREMGRSGVCGELCSLRFTWQRPGRSASAEEEFLYGSLVQYLYLAEDLAGSNLKKLYIVKAAGRNNLFALAEFENRIVAEFEMNETLPDSMPDTFFIKANFTDGHLTNQPIAGHFNGEGSVFADESGLHRFTVDSCEPEIAGGTLENIRAVCRLKGAPEMNGYETTKTIRNMPDRPDGKKIPIIAMTANAFAEDIETALDAGMDGHVAKPVNMDVLLSVITKCIKR